MKTGEGYASNTKNRAPGTRENRGERENELTASHVKRKKNKTRGEGVGGADHQESRKTQGWFERSRFAGEGKTKEKLRTTP